MEFDGLNVPTFRIAKRNDNFLAFNYLKLEDERVLLGSRIGDHDTALMTKIRQAAASGLSQRAIATELDISKTTVNRYMRIPTVEEQRWSKLSPEQRRTESIQRAMVARYQHSQSQAGQTAGQVPTKIEPYIPLDRTADEILDDECDCFECMSGNPSSCLETDWSEQCCDGTDPNCCGAANGDLNSANGK
jgi:predicted transcriptional regulator